MMAVLSLCLVAGCGGGGGGASKTVVDSATNPTQQTGGTGGQTQPVNDAKLYGVVVRQGGSGSRETARMAASNITPVHVTNPSPLSGATVKLTTESGGAAVTATTDSTGSFSLEKNKISDGVYSVEITGGAFSGKFYIEVGGAHQELLTEFADDTQIYNTSIRTGDSKNWTLSIEPDGSYVVKENNVAAEVHDKDGVTVKYAGGDENWYLDVNGNHKNDSSDPNAPGLNNTTDTDGDGCQNPRDFDDDDSDNDGNVNFDDEDYNTNQLARSVNGIAGVDCINDVNFFSVELSVTPRSGDAPLTVAANVTLRAARSAIQSFEWITGIPGAQARTTSEPAISITYSDYGKYILTVIVHLKNGMKLVDTAPILVAKPGNMDPLVFFNNFKAQCNNGATYCYTMDVDVDQFGNLFVLQEGWGTDHFNQVGIYNPDLSHLDTVNIDTGSISYISELINMALDDNGFIYVVDTLDTESFLIFDSMGNRIKSVSLSSMIPSNDGAFTLKGLAISRTTGDVFIGFSGFITTGTKIFKCEKAKNYACGNFLDLPDSHNYAVFGIDLEMDSNDNLAVLTIDSISYYSQSGTLIKTYNIGGEYNNMALGPDDAIYASRFGCIECDPYTENSGISVFNPQGVYQYSLGIQDFVSPWDMFVDAAGILYVATYDEENILVFGPQYMLNKSGARQVAEAAPAAPGFKVRRVNALRLDG